MIERLNTVIKNLKDAGANIEKNITKGFDNALQIAQSSAKYNAPEMDGYLRANIFKKIVKQGTKIEGCVYGTAEYHPYVELGTGPKGNGTYPYNIKGVSLNYKADKWRVNIPDVGVRWIAGQEAQPHMYPAFLILKDNLVDEIRKAGKIK